jgi:signal peptidase I
MATNVVSQSRGKKKSAGASPLRAAWELIKSLAGAILIYLVINTFFIAAYRIPSGSMIPTLLVGDWLFVNKLVYGPHIPFTHVRLPGYSDPRRGEVIVFESPYQADEVAQGREGTPTLVKRLVGVPGDTLYMRKGLLYVNGVVQRQGFGAIGASRDGSQPDDVDPLFDWQHKYELKQSRFGAAPAQPTHDNWGPLVIPSDRYFMMGDNRYCSKDGRYWGLVPRENIRGRPIFVYYSYRPATDGGACSGDGSDRPLPFLTDIRFGRIGTRIH